MFANVTEPGVVVPMAAALAIGLGSLGPGRNPEAEGAVRLTMIIGAALAEAVAIYAFVVAVIIAFVL